MKEILEAEEEEKGYPSEAEDIAAHQNDLYNPECTSPLNARKFIAMVLKEGELQSGVESSAN